MFNFDFLEKSLELFSPPHYMFDLLKKYLSCYILLTDQVGQYLYCSCFPVSDVVNFEINLSFLIKLFSHLTKKVRTKIWICSEWKEVFRWKNFSSFLKGFQLQGIVWDMRVRRSKHQSKSYIVFIHCFYNWA